MEKEREVEGFDGGDVVVSKWEEGQLTCLCCFDDYMSCKHVSQ